MSADLATLEAIVDAAGVAADVEAHMPTGGRPRQLSVRTLLLGIAVAIADGRPAHLTRALEALVGLPDADQLRLGVVVDGPRGPHTLTYRQVEHTNASMMATMDAARADGGGEELDAYEQRLGAFCDGLVEASIPPEHKDASTSVAVDWTDYDSFARATAAGTAAADPEASWGHRSVNTPGTRGEMFFGYYAQAVTMVADEGGPPVAELVRRICMHTCSTDPVPSMAAVLEAMAGSGVVLGDVLADSGYSHRIAERWAQPLRRIGARLVVDLHPHDRGPKGTFEGAIVANGNLYCPSIPPALLNIAPLARGAGAVEVAAHDVLCTEAALYKLGRICADDADGYHRVKCPASAGKIRCPLKGASMGLEFDRPEVLSPPEHPPACCGQVTITVPPHVNAKTRQKHDYPSPAHRRSYARRTGAERSFSTLKDRATTDIRRGWCRMMGRINNIVMLVVATVVRNLRVLAAFERRQAEALRRAAAGQPPPARKRRRLPPPQAA